jgi:catechol 2,3-dioxygenase-like lactoylglutathione lyase family enzyme
MMSLLKMTKDSIDIGIVVKDLDVAEKFYGGTLGLPIVREVALSADIARQSGCAGGPFNFKAFQAGDVQLKVVQAEAGPPSGTGKIDEATGVRYFTFSVESVEEAFNSLKAVGAAMQGEIAEVVPGRFICFFADPDGNLLECVGPK